MLVLLKEYHTKKINKPEPWCATNMAITVALTLGDSYKESTKRPGFGFSLKIYNNCESKY